VFSRVLAIESPITWPSVPDFKDFPDIFSSPCVAVDTEGGKKEPFIKGYKEHHTDTTVHFEIELTEKNMSSAIEYGLAKKFQMTKTLSTTNMHLFNSQGLIQKYDSPEEILREFYDLRIEFYGKRKSYMVSELERQLTILSNKVQTLKLNTLCPIHSALNTETSNRSVSSPRWSRVRSSSATRRRPTLSRN